MVEEQRKRRGAVDWIVDIASRRVAGVRRM